MNTPVQKQMCPTCPFRDESYEYHCLRLPLTQQVLSTASHQCHSTGEAAPEFIGKYGIPTKLCRGARDIQLQFFAAIGFIESATDEAWDKKRIELGV